MVLHALTYFPGDQAGGMFVNRAAKKFIAAEFLHANVSEIDTFPVTEVIEQFEEEKKEFDDPRKDKIKLRVGMPRMNVDSINVNRGQLTLDGYVI
jgi:hypothetical protein